MDTQQLEHSVRRLGQMLAEYACIEKLEDRLQEAVRESLLQRFEYTWEMAWKTGKRYLVEV
ncbi:MAG: nucleotidyltransferase substrate binding protein [Candidatus Thiosymbion ectosymbiont of Robbea hypermnestra]|nr:nucleotidyltransferase substrate binding protein [Candidatus Thiosymbion ectosymbiont of Robbea hypermnestra]